MIQVTFYTPGLKRHIGFSTFPTLRSTSGPQRAYWFGFAVCGWLYVALLFLGWNLPDKRRNLVPLEHNQLLTTWL